MIADECVFREFLADIRFFLVNFVTNWRGVSFAGAIISLN